MVPPPPPPLMQLLVSKMVSHLLQAIEFEVVSEAKFLTTSRSLLSPSLHNKQRHWYELLDDKNLASTRRISPEFAEFVGRTPDVVTLASIAFSASVLMFFDLLALNILQALSWLDLCLMAVTKVLGLDFDLHPCVHFCRS